MPVSSLKRVPRPQSLRELDNCAIIVFSMAVARDGIRMQGIILKPWLLVILSKNSVIRILGAMSDLIL
jgi:hypothetical protein